MKLRTHYDNLKVARNAPIEVIAAAYRSLSKMYHPDINKSDDAAKIFKMLNSAYETLSDPVRRKEHDEWIDKIEGNKPESSFEYVPPPKKVTLDKPLLNLNAMIRHIKPVILKWVLAIIVISCLFIWNNPFKKYVSTTTPISEKSSTYVFDDEKSKLTWDEEQNAFFLRYPIYRTDKTKWNLLNDAVIKLANQPSYAGKAGTTILEDAHYLINQPKKYIRPAYVIALGASHPIPTVTGYIDGCPEYNKGGYATVTIDNKQNNSDVVVKLFSLELNKPLAVRTVMIKANDEFKISDIKRGNYEVRYLHLDNGAYAASEPFDLKEIHSEDGVKYSNISMTLYKVVNGNMHSRTIKEEDFL